MKIFFTLIESWAWEAFEACCFTADWSEGLNASDIQKPDDRVCTGWTISDVKNLFHSLSNHGHGKPSNPAVSQQTGLKD